MAKENGLKNRIKFGEGQPTNLVGRPKKQPFIEIIKGWATNRWFHRI
jgi:hypothetical protein